MIKKISVFAGLLGLSAILVTGCSSDDSTKNVFVNGRGPLPAVRPGVPAPAAKVAIPGKPGPAPAAKPGPGLKPGFLK